jgi:hypothetical protein
VITTGDVVANTDGSFFQVDGDDEYYEIIGLTAATDTIQLATQYVGTTDAAATYEIFKSKYGLFPDFADILDIVPLTGNTYGKPLRKVTPSEMRILYARFPGSEATIPECYTIVEKGTYHGPAMGSEFITGYDFTGTPERPEVIFWPPRFDETVLSITYGKQVDELSADADEPLMPREKRMALVYGALADWFEMQRNTKAAGIFEAKFRDYEARMEADFDANITETASIVPARGNRLRQVRPYRISVDID